VFAWRCCFVGATLLLVLGATTASCGADEDTSGFAPAGEDEDLPDGGKKTIDWATAWPTEDDSPESAATGTPIFPWLGGGAAPVSDVTCAPRPGPNGERTISLDFGGITRTSIVHVPPGYSPDHGAALVLNFHGFTSDGLQEEVLSRMNAASDQLGFIVAYPYGVGASWNAGTCCGTAWTDSVDDVHFVRTLMTELSQSYCLDSRRIYATGMSNGGFLSHRLACEASDVFAAVAPVAGVLGIPMSECHPGRPVPILHFHGKADPVVPYDGGNPVVDIGLNPVKFASVAETMNAWRTIDGCTGGEEVLYDVGDARCVSWGGCKGGAHVVLCSIEGGGHTWPGGVPVPPLGHTSADLSATLAMLGFFAAHPMP
jgi:polyhydroxybutyrate depolymerase